jgi:hypothetical protein
MGLGGLVRSGIALANSITGTLQVDVIHHPWIGSLSDGMASYGLATVRRAIVEAKQEQVRTFTGEEATSRAMVTIIGPVEDNGAAGRREPIDPRDRLILPDGTTGPILDVQGLVDAGTGRPYMYQIALGGDVNAR